MRHLTLLLVIAFFSFACAQGKMKHDQQAEQNIPTTLAEAHKELERLLPPDELARIDKMETEDEMITYHFTLGMRIRNSWGLRGGSQLARHMQELGFTHPDDMSSVILDTFWCKRHKQDFRLKERAAHYKAYWEATSNPLLQVSNIQELAKIAHGANAKSYL